MLPNEIDRWRLIDLPATTDWVHRSGKMVIIGDAAHATLPYLAQGAAMAIEDAAVLGFTLSQLRSLNELPDLLDFFYEARVERVHAIQRGSFTNRSFIHMKDDDQLDMRHIVFTAGDYPSSNNLLGNTLFQDWLYGYDALLDTSKKWEQRKSKTNDQL
jgi:salicylate hydroxylase